MMNLWDEKASTYQRYNKNLNPIQKRVLQCLADFDLSDKNILEIGCGTGVFTLHLASKALSITALDSSQAMLDILSQDAKALKLNNILSLHQSFQDFYQDFFSKQQSFDLIFMSMCPALQSLDDFQAFLKLAKTRFYLGWASKRQSDMLEPIFKAFNCEFKALENTKLEHFLKQNNISYKKELFNEKRIKHMDKNQALNNALWHLKMHGKNVSLKELEPFFQSESITETIHSKIKLLIF